MNADQMMLEGAPFEQCQVLIWLKRDRVRIIIGPTTKGEMLVNDLTLTEYRDAPRELKAITAITAEDLLRRGLIATASTVEIFDMDEHEANMRIVLPTEKAPTQ